MRVSFLLAVVVLLLGAHPQTQRITTFRQTPDGNWQTTVTTPDGRSFPYVVVPGNKLMVSVRSHERAISAADAVVEYRYDVVNSRLSEQRLGWLWIAPGVRDRPSIRVTEAPIGWNTDAGFSSTTGAFPPGSNGRFVFEAKGFPGVVDLNVMGDIDALAEVPGGLTESQTRDLERIRNATITAAGIGPKLVVRGNETRVDLLKSVLGHYSTAFITAKHAHSSELVRLASLPQSEALFATSLEQLRLIAARSADDPWQASLSEALGVCVDILSAQKPPE